MLSIHVQGKEFFDEETCQFVSTESEVIELEHSLYSVSKWESKWKKPFLGKGEKTPEELLDYIKCMTLNPVDDSVYNYLTSDNVDEIYRYMEDPFTATTISENGNKSYNEKIITAEVMYSWLVNLQIPFEVQYWHLNKMIMLVRVINEQNNPNKKKMSNKEIYASNAAKNAQRRAKLHSKG